jgi:hypothetical protein
MMNSSFSPVIHTQDSDLDEYFAHIADMVIYIFSVPIPPILMTAVLIGNFLSFRLMNLKKYQKSTTCFYMRCMAVSDSFYIYGRMFLLYIIVMAPHLFQSETTRKPFCLNFKFSLTMGNSFSPWILVAMASDRFIALTWPLKARVICTMRRANITFSILIPGTVSSSLLTLSSYKDKYKHWFCYYNLEEPWDQVHATFEVIYLAFLPIISLVVFNVGDPGGGAKK